MNFKKLLTHTAASLIVLFSLTSFGCTSNKPASNSTSSLPKLQVNSLGMFGGIQNIKKINVTTAFTKPDKFKVYRIKKANVTANEVTQIASKLGVNGSTIKDTGTTFQMVSPDKKLIVDKDTGSITFTTKEWEESSNPMKQVKTDNEYIKLAETYLNEKSLMKEGTKFFRIKSIPVINKIKV